MKGSMKLKHMNFNITCTVVHDITGSRALKNMYSRTGLFQPGARTSSTTAPSSGTVPRAGLTTCDENDITIRFRIVHSFSWACITLKLTYSTTFAMTLTICIVVPSRPQPKPRTSTSRSNDRVEGRATTWLERLAPHPRPRISPH